MITECKKLHGGSAQLFVTFFSDGRFFEGQPDYGLLGFDIDREIQREPPGWGTYEFSANRGRAIFFRQPGEEGPPTMWGLLLRADRGVVVIGDTRSEYTSESGILYTLLDRCDGLRLEGTFLRSDFRTFDPWVPGIPSEAVTFTRDGRFVDRGFVDATGVLWRTPDGGFAEDDKVPGTGIYRIANYTLELRYSDGRVKPLFFYLEPGTSKAGVREFYANTWKFVRVD